MMKGMLAMRAICLDDYRAPKLSEIVAPGDPPEGYVNVSISAAGINHGDITFMKLPDAAGGARGKRIANVWGSSAAGIVMATGQGVPASLFGRKVAIYRSLQPDSALLGLWCETAQVRAQACLPLPDHLDERDYCGSLVNVTTAYGFLDLAISEGHRGIVVTAGNAATGRALVTLAARRGVSTLVITRNAASRAGLEGMGAQVLASDAPDFLAHFEATARELNATAVFDGVGGSFVSDLLPALPTRSTIYFYGFLSGRENVSFHSALFMAKDLTMRRFNNYEAPATRDPARLAAMLNDLEGCIEHSAFRTIIGQAFDLAEIDAALGYHAGGGRKAILLP